MTERYGSGYGDESGQRPSGRGAVTERRARHGQGAHEIDLTDEATRREAGEDTAASPETGPDGDPDRESSGAFEPPAPTADPPAEATRPGSTSIFDVDQRARQEELEPTGYEPPVSDADPAQPRGETIVTEPGDSQPDEVQVTRPGDGQPDEPTDITPTPVPVTDPAAAPVQGLPEPPATASPATSAAEGEGGAAGSLLGTLDAGVVRNRFLDIQAGFVDEPRQAVEEAGRFVDELVQQVVDALQGQRGQLTATTGEGSTEDLRLALRAYRQFVDRLLGLAN
jgi:hypothetical protein